MILSHEKISKLETILPQDKFLRVHKSFIVSISKIETIVGTIIWDSEIIINKLKTL